MRDAALLLCSSFAVCCFAFRFCGREHTYDSSESETSRAKTDLRAQKNRGR